MSVVSSTTWKSWTAQRILNRFPIWSRARTRDDAVARYMFNPLCIYMDEMYENLIGIKRNYYIGKTDLLEQAFIYTVDLPNTFEFVEAGNTQGIPTYEAPQVTGVIGASAINIEVSDLAQLQQIEKAAVAPTRIDATKLFSTFNDIVVPETQIISLDSVVVNDEYVDELGYIYVEIDDATQFGEILNDGRVVRPKVIIKGTPWLEDDAKEEHLGYRANSERRSIERWDEIEIIETHGIYDGGATLRAHTGFSKRSLQEPMAFWTDDLQEVTLLYNISNNTFGSNHLPTIQFLVPEITSPTLRQQGFSTDVLEYEFGVMLDHSTYLPNPIVGLERMPFTRWFVVATNDSMHIISARIPHLFNWISEDDNGTNIVSDALKSRSIGPELHITSERNWMNYSEDGTSFLLETRHAKPVRGIRSTRLSITYDSPGLSTPVVKYYDWSANEIDIVTDFNNGWIFNSSSDASPTDWDEKHLTIDVSSVLDHPAWVAVVKLEAKMTDNTTESDVLILHSDIRTVEKTIDWPDEIKGKVNGILYDAKDRLLVRTTDNEVWIVNTYWDYCLIDYKRGTVFLREEYDSVGVTS